jgi:RNA polymerase sigma-70 factor (ECF subfamily)
MAVYALAFARTRDRDEADDLTQEVLIRAWERLKDLRDPARFPAWLKAITMNACASWFRRSGNWPRSLDEVEDRRSLPGGEDTPLEVVLKQEEHRLWRKVLMKLPEANSHALLMHLWGGYSYEEIATFIGVPITTVEGRIFRAKQQLRRLLNSDAGMLLGEFRRRWQEGEETDGK